MDQKPRRRFESWLLASDELQSASRALPSEDFEHFTTQFDHLDQGRTFFTGQGRSGLCARMAAMRFMHLGLPTHVVGEATAPSIRACDTLIVVSGGGRTPTSVAHARTAKDLGATVLLVTHQPSSPLHDLADHSIVLPVASSRQFGGTLFEHSALLLLDAIVLDLMRALPDADSTMLANHTNLE